jgi:indolepyruvate ferredoxin oxidoreductase
MIVSESAIPEATNHVGEEQADVLLALDTIVAASQQVLAATSSDTRLVGSVATTPTASMVMHPNGQHDDPAVLVNRIESACAPAAEWLDSTAIADRLVGAPATANMVVLGAAFQAGLLPVGWRSLVAAVELNGVAAAANVSALGWGRCAVADPVRLALTLEAAGGAGPEASRSDLQEEAPVADLRRALVQLGAPAELVARATDRAARLVDYQDTSLAGRYADLVLRTAGREQAVEPGCWDLTHTVAGELHHVMAYKDEYEVARLLGDESAVRAAEGLVEGPARVSWNLRPPLLRALGMQHKLRVSSRLAPAMGVLARGKSARGRWFDPFGHTRIRRAERRLVRDYVDALERALVGLSPTSHRRHVERLGATQSVRGYEERKLVSIREATAMLRSG